MIGEAASPTSSGVAVLLLAGLHVGARHLTALDRIPRSRWLSAAGGVSVAYVMVQLLPEVAAVQQALDEAAPWIDRHAWLLALAGLVTFYALEQHAEHHRRRAGGGHTPDRVGRLHIAAYGAYNALIGYLLVERAAEGAAVLVPFAIAIGLHLVVNDHGLQEDHGPLYARTGRWLLVGALVVGWGVGVAFPVPEAALGAVLAVLAGSVVLNVLKEELPSERESRPLPFAASAAAYAGLLLAL